jgi:hypothetical protein
MITLTYQFRLAFSEQLTIERVIEEFQTIEKAADRFRMLKYNEDVIPDSAFIFIPG